MRSKGRPCSTSHFLSGPLWLLLLAKLSEMARELYRFVLVVLLSVLMGNDLLQSAETESDCARVLLADVPAELHCQTNCTPSKDTVTWCIALFTPDVPIGQLPWSLCINSSGRVQRNDVPQEILNINIIDSGAIYIPKVSYLNSQSSFNCTVANEDGGVCGYEEFDLSVYAYTPDPFEPPDLFDDGEDVVQVKIGMTEVLCLSGRSPGSNGDTYWTKGETVIPSLNISDSLNCSKSFDCSDCIEELLSVPVVTQTESHYASFHVTYSSYSDDLVNECSEPNRFVSFLVISQVAPEDAGEYGFVFTSLRNRFTETHKEVNTVYVQEKPTFHHQQDHEKSVIKDSNAFFICNATTSHDATLQWTVFDGDRAIQDMSDVIQKPVTLDDNTLTDLCSTIQQRFSSTLSQMDTPRDSDGATLLLQQSALVLCNAQYSHTGTYICKASDFDSDHHLVDVVVITSNEEPTSEDSDVLIIVPVVVTSALLIPCALLFICIVWKCRLRLQKSGAQPMSPIASFPFTNPFVLTAISQRNLVTMEFPRERLILLEVIGEGQFGQVWKAEAAGICHSDQNRKIVAVKTLKPIARPSDRRDLRIELEIMKQMEPHPNILNFLGQCSERNNQPLFILMEFAVYGSLKDYLQTVKTSHAIVEPSTTNHNYLCAYHNQQQDIEIPGNDDPTSTNPATARLLRLLQSEYHYRYSRNAPAESPPPYSFHKLPLKGGTFDTLVPELSRSQYAYRPCLEDPYHWYPNQTSEYTDYYNHSEGIASPKSPHSTLLSPTYTNVPDVDPSREHFTDAYAYAPSVCTYCSHHVDSSLEEPEIHPLPSNQGGLTHSEVLDFALQIARGMVHLERMKCVHRDLAARNVLIAENFLLKIGDFGLSRDLSDSEYYRKTTAGKLPARWMATESLEERKHTYKSDVWSFGVVLWEIMTYGDTPYGRSPYANSIQSLALYLQAGNRLTQPPGCSDEMYDVMRKCWSMDPDARPSFTELLSTFDNLLSDAHGYLKMDETPTQTGPVPPPTMSGATTIPQDVNQNGGSVVTNGVLSLTNSGSIRAAVDQGDSSLDSTTQFLPVVQQEHTQKPFSRSMQLNQACVETEV